MTTINQLERKIAEFKRRIERSRYVDPTDRDAVLRDMGLPMQSIGQARLKAVMSAQNADPASMDINATLDSLETSVQTGDFANARDLLSQLSDWLDYAESAVNSSGTQVGAGESYPASGRALHNNPLYPEFILKKHRPKGSVKPDPLYPERG